MLMKAFLVLALAALVSSNIPPGYKEFKGLGHFKLYTNSLNFGAAWKTCHDEGSNLVVINSQREVSALRELFAANPKVNEAWIGVHDMFFENIFTTVLGYPLTTAGYIRWRGGEPNNSGGNENCVSIAREGAFNDESCNKAMPFFCEA